MCWAPCLFCLAWRFCAQFKFKLEKPLNTLEIWFSSFSRTPCQNFPPTTRYAMLAIGAKPYRVNDGAASLPDGVDAAKRHHTSHHQLGSADLTQLELAAPRHLRGLGQDNRQTCRLDPLLLRVELHLPQELRRGGVAGGLENADN